MDARRRGATGRVWAVDVNGLWLEGDPSGGGDDDGWMIVREPIPPSRLRLAETSLDDEFPGDAASS